MHIEDQDLYLFHEGTHTRLHDLLGAHLVPGSTSGECRFAVWAPNASRVDVVGDFNQWSTSKNSELSAHGESGLFLATLENVNHGDHYKIRVTSRSGRALPLKSDPFGRMHREAPDNASIVVSPRPYAWGDERWMEERATRQALDRPIAVYELHAGSWRRHKDGRPLSYRELADELIRYLDDLGFTHVELMPVMEHPFYGSWGYQCTGYFAPTSRYGTPDDFKYFVDTLHQSGYGVFLDWVPSHFPEDDHGLALFDGTHLFDHADDRKGYHPDWKSRIFNYDRHEVRSFLLSSARFWLETFHVDGLRVDAVASMLYLDYSRAEGEWIPNIYGGRENLGAVHFLKRLNELIYQDFPDIHMIAEESTAWPGVTRMTAHGGLGFGMKWDMGWMHDTLQYMQRDPIHRAHHHRELTFRAIYAQSEQYMLSLSHDEVVHGKGSLFRKMSGHDGPQKGAELALLYAWMYAQPGKKLLFMGGEFGQPTEWNHDTQLQWEVLREGHDAIHGEILALMRELNACYRSTAALHEEDFSSRGFEWVCADDHAQSVVAFLRWDRARQAPLLAIFNFTPVRREGYRLGAPLLAEGTSWRVALDTSNTMTGHPLHQNTDTPSHGQESSVCLDLPPSCALYLVPV